MQKVASVMILPVPGMAAQTAHQRCITVPVKKPSISTTGIESAYFAQHRAIFSNVLQFVSQHNPINCLTESIDKRIECLFLLPLALFFQAKFIDQAQGYVRDEIDEHLSPQQFINGALPPTDPLSPIRNGQCNYWLISTLEIDTREEKRIEISRRQRTGCKCGQEKYLGFHTLNIHVRFKYYKSIQLVTRNQFGPVRSEKEFRLSICVCTVP